jgi:regulatory protein
VSESQSRRLARAFQVLESASKAFVAPNGPGGADPSDSGAPRAPGESLPWSNNAQGNSEERRPSSDEAQEAAKNGSWQNARPGQNDEWAQSDGRAQGNAPLRGRGRRGRRRSDEESEAGDGSTSKRRDAATKRERGADLTPEEAAERVSPTALDRAALDYLNRYDASVEQLRRVLLRRVKRYSSGTLRDRAEVDVGRLLERFVASRLLDDARYAEALARGLRARGSSTLGIRQKLRARGVSAELIESALEALAKHHGEGAEDPELVAARAYARKRRLTTRYDLTNPAERQKALAALARKGFSFSIAARALIVKDDSEW